MDSQKTIPVAKNKNITVLDQNPNGDSNADMGLGRFFQEENLEDEPSHSNPIEKDNKA